MIDENRKKIKVNSIASGTIWSIIDNTAAQAITFIIFLMLARILNPEIYGMLSVSILVTQLFRSVIFDSIATAIVRKAAPSEDDYNTSLILCFVLSVPAFLIVFFSAPLIMKIIGIPGLDNVIRGTSFIILVIGLSRTHEAWLTHKLMFRPLAIRSVFSITIGGATGIYLAYKGYGVASLVTQQIIASLVSALTLWLATPWRPKLKFNKSSALEIVNYSKHVSLSAVTNFTNQYSDIFFVSYFLGATQTGVYSTGKRIVNTVNVVISAALMRVSLPAFSRVRDDKNKFKAHYLNATYLTILITAPAFIGLSYLSRDITLLLLGNKWIDSVPVMQIVSLVGFVTSIGYYNHSVMFACDRPDWQARLTLLYAISNVIVFAIFVRFGLITTALAFSIRTIALYPISAWCALTLLNIRWREYINHTLIPFLGSVFMCLIIWLADKFIKLEISWIKIFLDILIGALSYSIFNIIFTDTSKKQMIMKIFRKDKTAFGKGI